MDRPTPPDSLLLKDALAQAAAVLLKGTTPQQARRDAELLLMHSLDYTRAFVLSHPEAVLSSSQVERYEVAISRRAQGEPIQYITGQQEFYGLTFAVTPDVLIPRPETELLVEALLERVDREVPMRIVDVGTGSGAIVIALATHLPLAELTAVDLSAAALQVARANAKTHGVAARIRLLESDLLSAVIGERFDFVVSNPPYVSIADRNSLAVEVREHEPEIALFAGVSGVDVYERLVPEARQVLSADGQLLMEVGYGQRDAVAILLESWTDVKFLSDLQGIPRVVCARP